MESREATRSSEESSSALSTPPEGTPTNAPGRNGSTQTTGIHNRASVFDITGAQSGVAKGAAAHPSKSGAAAVPATTGGQATESLKVKPQRKAKKEPVPQDAKKKPRKPRAAPGSSAVSTTATTRKKPKLEPSSANVDTKATIPGSTQSLITSTINFQPQPPHSNKPTPQPPYSHEAPHHSRKVFSIQDSSINHNVSPKPTYHQSYSTNESPTASSNMYDPVRSMNIQRPSTATPQPALHQNSDPHLRPVFNPSASPAISGIIDPPTQNLYTNPTPFQSRPEPETARVDPPNATFFKPDRPPSTTMDIDLTESGDSDARRNSVPKKSPVDENGIAAAPKTRAKEQPPPLPAGSGLLSSSLFGGLSTANDIEGGDKVPNIVLHIDLKGQNNKIINFARMAEEKYGFAALYPRLAAQNERLARVAAAGAAIERSASGSRMGGTSAGESGDDDASVDIDRDSDNDGDIPMSGLNGNGDAGNSGTDGQGPKKRRRKKIEDYDQDDPFVDDSELVWESQAAASKDGFFVYCGPLVPEGEKPAVERADGTVKRGRGRGRGGGPGSRGGRGAASAAPSLGQGTGRGGGPGSRGGNVARKPRIKRAERAIREMEKLDAERMAPLAAKPTASALPA